MAEGILVNGKPLEQAASQAAQQQVRIDAPQTRGHIATLNGKKTVLGYISVPEISQEIIDEIASTVAAKANDPNWTPAPFVNTFAESGQPDGTEQPEGHVAVVHGEPILLIDCSVAQISKPLIAAIADAVVAKLKASPPPAADLAVVPDAQAA